MTNANDAAIRAFTAAFESKDPGKLASFLHPDVVFRNYGDPEITGRDRLLQMWAGVFARFEVVRFETVHQAVNRDVVLAEQVHHLGRPGHVAPIMNLAVYEMHDGLITAWRDYTNPEYARTLF